MNSFVEILNQWGGRFVDFAWLMLWQSSLLIVLLLAVEFFIRRQIRASIRYALWLVVLAKLCLPPTLALPTSPVWWLHKSPTPVVAKLHYTVAYDTAPMPDIPLNSLPTYVPPKPSLTAAAGWLVVSGFVSACLLVWLLARWCYITRQVRQAQSSDRLTCLLNETRRLTGVKSKVPVKLTGNAMSPAVCGLFRPVILIPQSLAERFSDDQLRAVLLHEMVHLRRRDVWLNFLQALVQIFYWWHPLVWLANARIRRLREEAVDDTVMLALRDDSESYAPTLLQVARLALNRPLASLGLVGILESRSALRERIERLVNFRAPHRAGLTFASLCGVLVFGAAVLPMGEVPSRAENVNSTQAAAAGQSALTLKVNPEMFIKNVKAQAVNSLLSPTNDYTDILLDLLRGEGVDCAPPNGIAFNAQTGEITTQNTPDKLAVFRRVIEQLNRADGQCELPLGNNPLRKTVVIEARIYQMPSGDFDNFVSGLQFYQASAGGDDWWSASPEQFSQLIGHLEASGLRLIQRPRIQTGSGITAEFFIGNGTNNVEFDCKPFVANGSVDLTLQGTVSDVAPASAAFTNYFGAKASAENHGGIVVRIKNYGGDAGNNLVAAIGVEIVSNAVQFQERLRVTIGPRNSTNTAAPATPWEANPLKAGGIDSSLESTPKVEQLFTRTFTINPHALTDLSRNMPGLETNDIVAMARSLFSKLGIDWDSPKGKTIFYTERLGWLYVRATRSDLDTIQSAIPELKLLPPQIHVKARFIVVPKGTLGAFGNPGNMIVGTNQPDQFVGILTGDNAKIVLKSLESRRFEELAEPEVTTTSGRQTEMRATEVVTVTNLVFTEGLESGSNSITPQAERVEIGPLLDVVPNVLADGKTIDLKTVASLTEFLGYHPPTNGYGTTNQTVAVNSAGQRIDLPTISPAFAIRKASARVTLWDGQTVVLGAMGGMKARFYDGGRWVNTEPDFLRKAKAAEGRPNDQDKELLVFITATLIDAAGNRIHSDEDMPFAKNSIPPQDRP